MKSIKKCPFTIGECVIYLPSQQGHNQQVMFSDSGQLIVGQKYQVVDIEKEFYIVVNGFRHPSGGIHWSEFKSCD